MPRNLRPMKRARALPSTGETELVRVYQPIVRVYLLVMAAYYACLVVAHQVFLVGWPAWLMSGVAMVGCVSAFALFQVMARSARRIVNLGRAAFAMHCVVLLNIATHTVALNAPDQLGYLPIVAFAVGMIGPTRRTVFVSIGVIVVTLAFLTAIIRPIDHVHLIFTAAIAAVGASIAAHWVHRLVKQALLTRLRSERMSARLIAERGRNRDLVAQKAAAEAAIAARAQFTANVSHELRTPLNAIIGYGELLLEANDLPPDSVARQDVGRVLLAAANLLNLVNDVLDLTKIEAGQFNVAPIAIDVRAECEKCLEIVYSSALAKGIELKLDSRDGQFLAMADPNRFAQCVLNLLSNAIKFTEEGAVSVSVRRIGDMIEVEVADTGAGIADANLERIFEPFEQVDSSITRKHNGVGLGLAITRKLAERMGGSVKASSTIGIGSRFLLRLPAADSVPQHDMLDVAA